MIEGHKRSLHLHINKLIAMDFFPYVPIINATTSIDLEKLWGICFLIKKEVSKKTLERDAFLYLLVNQDDIYVSSYVNIIRHTLPKHYQKEVKEVWSRLAVCLAVVEHYLEERYWPTKPKSWGTLSPKGIAKYKRFVTYFVAKRISHSHPYFLEHLLDTVLEDSSTKLYSKDFYDRAGALCCMALPPACL